MRVELSIRLLKIKPTRRICVLWVFCCMLFLWEGIFVGAALELLVEIAGGAGFYAVQIVMGVETVSLSFNEADSYVGALVRDSLRII